jgi:excisionase family DNA binding protein
MKGLIPASEKLGMSKFEAAEYVGFGVSLFEQMVTDGRMPRPKQGNRRLVWSRFALEKAFAELPDGGPVGQSEESHADDWDDVA